MVTKFERPEDESYPNIYHIFKARGLNGDELVEYHIKVLTDDYFDDAVDLMLKYLCAEEPFQRAFKVTEKDYFVQYMSTFFKKAFQERISLACFVSGSNELVSVNALTVKTKGVGEKWEGSSNINEINRFLSCFDYVFKKFDVFEHFHVDHYLMAVGLCVHSAYRNRQIATEILKARIPLLRCLKLTVTSTLFSTLGAQKAAIAANYKEMSSTDYEEIRELKVPELDFSHSNVKCCKIFSLKI